MGNDYPPTIKRSEIKGETFGWKITSKYETSGFISEYESTGSQWVRIKRVEGGRQ